MKFSLQVKDLVESVTLAAYATAPKASAVRMILSNIMLVADEDKNEVKFVGTDLEIMMIATIKTEVESGGYFTIPAKIFNEVANSISVAVKDTTTAFFELNPEEGYSLDLTVGRKKFSLQVQSVSDYPPVPVFNCEDEENSVELQTYALSAKDLLKGIDEASIAISSEESSPVQKSLCMNLTDTQKPILVATDSKRLAVTSIENFAPPEELADTYLIPAKAVEELKKLLGNCETIEVGIYNKQLVFGTEKYKLITRLVDGKFPNHERIIPKESSRILKMNKTDLGESLKLVMPIARINGGLVNFDVSENETRLWSDSREEGLAESFVASQLSGEPIKIGFNVRYLQDFINVVEAENVLIEMTTPNYPGLLKPDNPDSHYMYVIMPMAF